MEREREREKWAQDDAFIKTTMNHNIRNGEKEREGEIDGESTDATMFGKDYNGSSYKNY